MSSKSTVREFLLSSTPFQSSEEDSGYFGSSRKSFYGSNSRALNTFSPIKELHFKNQSENFSDEYLFHEASPVLKFNNKVLEYENFNKDFYESSSIEINDLSELEFTSDSDFRESKICKSSEQKFFDSLSFSEDSENQSYSISSVSKDEGTEHELFEGITNDLMNKNLSSGGEFYSRNVFMKQKLQGPAEFNQTKVDFIDQLKERNCFLLISEILDHLSEKELCIASCVSKKWSQIIQCDRKANHRRTNFIKERKLYLNGPSKENRLGMRCGPARELKKAFSNLTNINAVECLVISKDSSSKFDSFIKESNNGHTKLLKCPKCCYASKYFNGNNLMCTRCSHTFCGKCLSPVFKNHSCSKPQLPNIIVGSKKSKKNLRRL